MRGPKTEVSIRDAAYEDPYTCQGRASMQSRAFWQQEGRLDRVHGSEGPLGGRQGTSHFHRSAKTPGFPPPIDTGLSVHCLSVHHLSICLLSSIIYLPTFTENVLCSVYRNSSMYKLPLGEL